MEQVLSVLLLSLSANLDTFLIAMSYSLNNVKIPFNSSLLITLITTLGTYISILLGELLSSFLPEYLPNILGGVTLLIIGLWIVFDYIIKLKYKINSPEKDDKNNIKETRIISLKEAIPLSFALTANNIGIGVAAGITDINIVYLTILTFIITILCINIGTFIGKGIISNIIGKYSTILSGFILIILGLYEIILN